MQRNQVNLGTFNDQHPSCQFILEDAVAAVGTRRLCHSARHVAKRFPHPRDRPALRECRATDDSQRDPPPRRSGLFRTIVDSAFARVVVATQG